MTRTTYLIAFSFLLINAVSMGQEILTGLSFNEAVYQESVRIAEQQKVNGFMSESPVLTLPFFDDFTTSNIVPDNAKWMDRSVFINKDFPYFPVNIGAATFDALDSTGKIYSNAEWVPFEADKLTSNAIRLDSIFDPVVRKLTPSDSIYLSFFYQPQGYGRKPEAWDTLILEFSYMGDTVFAYYDTVMVPLSEILSSPLDTIYSGDTIWTPEGYGCDPGLYKVAFNTYSWEDVVWLPCDSVMLPKTEWQKVWKVEGSSLEEFVEKNDRYFVQVMIPIIDIKYFYSAFHFRFRNYASIANEVIPSFRSNDDQWNVDYVYLNYNRDKGDTTYRVLTFSQRAPSFLKDYQVMPYRQYVSNPHALKENFRMYIANLDKPGETHDASYLYKVEQVNGDYSFWYDGGTCNLLPFYPGNHFQDITSCPEHANPPVAAGFKVENDTTSYIIKHYISDSSDVNIIVDSAIYHQGFYNYYAYDDGTPEAGYGIENAGAMMAYRFNMTVQDTLFGVQMYFNRTKDNANELPFDLMVWRDNNKKPEDNPVYVMENQKPKWADDGLYNFYAYLFEDPIALVGDFYVGWMQYENGSLNVGFDANNDHAGNILYYAEGNWYTSDRSGSLLIRPIIGSRYVLGQEEQKPRQLSTGLTIHPNPARDYFMVDMPDLANDPFATIDIFSVYGTLVHHRQSVQNKVDVSSLPPGLYVVRLESSNRMYTTKLVINR
jgi:hypothetical protein